MADRFSSRPDKDRVFSSLTALHKDIVAGKTKKGLIIPFNPLTDKFIVLSDQHKGAKNEADDFLLAEKNYLAALDFYFTNNYYFINLGDCEELWENLVTPVKANNKASFEKEKMFLQQNRYYKVFGNHDLYWANDPFLAPKDLKDIYGQAVNIYEGAILQGNWKSSPLEIFLTHGHQGDLQSDGNWFSKWFVSNVWAKVQAYLKINPNTPAYDTQLKTEHNKLMYEWSSANNKTLITGHTHQPVFESLTLLERLYNRLSDALSRKDEAAVKDIESHIHVRMKKGEVLPDFTGYVSTYFNSGCCCFSDGDITGIEIEGGFIRLIKWEYLENNEPVRIILEESTLDRLIEKVEAV